MNARAVWGRRIAYRYLFRGEKGNDRTSEPRTKHANQIATEPFLGFENIVGKET